MTEKGDARKPADFLFFAIIGTAAAYAIMLTVVFFRQEGPGSVVAVLPWFIPVISAFHALTLFCVAFLAIGRCSVLSDRTYYSVGLGAAGFGVALAFHALAWPGLLPGGGALIGHLPGTSVWLLQIGITLFSTALLAAVLMRPTMSEKSGDRRLVVSAAAWMFFLTVVLMLVVVVEQHLPALLSPAGVFRPYLLAWNAAVAVLFAVGAVLSVRRYRRTGEAFLGYIAIAQTGFAFVIFATVGGMRRYDLWWYLLRVIITGSVLVVLFGMLYEYVQLFRREKAKTALLLSSEKRWRESETRYRTLFESIDQGFCIIEVLFNTDGAPVDYRFVEMNAAFETHTGLRDVAGKRMRELTPWHEEHWFEIYGRVALTGRAERFTNEAKQLKRWFEVYAFRFGQPEERTVAVLFSDISARKRAEEALRESEERLRLFFEYAPAALAMFDRDMRYLSVSRRWRSDYKLGQSNLIGQSHYDIFPEIPDTWKAVHRRALAGEVLRADSERFARVDGSVHWLRWEVRPWRDASGTIAGIVLFSEDVTARMQAEEALRQLNEHLEQRVIERTELAKARARQLQALAVELIEAEEGERRRIADLLHEDLQQILASARMQLQAGRANVPHEPMFVHAERLLEEAIAKSRSLSHELSPAVLHHAGLIAALQWLIRRKHEQFGLQVALETRIDEHFVNVPIKIFLFRAVQELLFNVVKHAAVTSAQVLLAGSDYAIAITVSDQGRGFAPEILDSGTLKGGLGLISLRERARYIGGRLDIRSASGQGTRITLTVPASPSKVRVPERIS
ncbi:MAG: hypothetical protein VR64_15995 [Desulfatitalea sp. BRH_c12]|nr:MAG: hypothetical protein VR64_15995 [Desulfatitalea sp. BRH_c12]